MDLDKLFKAMFPDSEIAEQFKLSKTKCSYFIKFGIAPVFKTNLTKEINMSPFYSVSFDESMNSVMQQCQMDVVIRYWNETAGNVETRYHDSKFLSRPNAKELLSNIENVAKNFKTEKFLQLAVDGPSVNWSVLNMLDNKLEENNLSKTINIGSCSQHTVHGTLKQGATKNEWDIDRILKALFWILSDSPARRDDYVREGGSEVCC